MVQIQTKTTIIMEYDKKTIDIPEGYEIDFEATKKSGPVVLKKLFRPKDWRELTRTYKDKDSFLYSSAFDEVIVGNFESRIGFGEFEDKETTCAFVALWRLLNYRKAWIGNWKPDWTNKEQIKFAIIDKDNKIEKITSFYVSHPMSFPIEKMRNEFYESFKDLLEVAKPLL